MRLSARGYHRVLRVARTLADLDGAAGVRRLHVAEALSYRRMAFARLEEQALGHDSAEGRQVDRPGVLEAVAEAATGRDERVGEAQRANLHGEVGRQSHTISAPSNTGPLMQERTKWCPPVLSLRGTTQL